MAGQVVGVRQRRRTQAQTEDREWMARRHYVMEVWSGRLEESNEFFEREAGIPDELREPPRRHDLMAERHEDRIRLRADYDRQLDARRAWLRSHGWGEWTR